jgi:uncharacterized protein YkwD
MKRFRLSVFLAATALIGAVAHADVLGAVQNLREGGCGGTLPAAQPLHRSALLDRAAEQWAAGRTLSMAAAGSGYAAAAGVFVRGPERGLIERMRRSDCTAVMDLNARAVGLYQRGQDRWLVLAAEAASSRAGSAVPVPQLPAAPHTPSPASGSAQPRNIPTGAAPELAERALQLVNAARARGARCGARPYAPAPPLTLSQTLDGVAFGHAADMAVHNYFEHVDLTGQSPADRVRATGYREQLVGENIAYGPQTVEEVVQGWLDSPDHCENVMDPRFTQMGLADAAGRPNSTRHGLYWVQLFAEPRS